MTVKTTPAMKKALKTLREVNALPGYVATESDIGASAKTIAALRKAGMIDGNIAVYMTPKGRAALAK